MKVGYRHAFEVLEPPSHGLTRLRGRLEANRGHRGRARATWLAASCLVAAAIVLVVSHVELVRHRAAGPLAGRDGFAALAASGAEPVSVPERARGATAVHRVALPDDGVVFYLVLQAN